MKQLLKFLISLTIFFIGLSTLDKWFKTIILGRYWEHASIFASFVTICLVPTITVLLTCLCLNWVFKSKFDI